MKSHNSALSLPKSSIHQKTEQFYNSNMDTGLDEGLNNTKHTNSFSNSKKDKVNDIPKEFQKRVPTFKSSQSTQMNESNRAFAKTVSKQQAIVDSYMLQSVTSGRNLNSQISYTNESE